MKKILLATSALVAMTGVAFAGGMVETMAPAAPVANGFTVTATGEAVLFGFYNGTPAATQGIGGSFEAEIKAAKTLNDGAEVSVALGISNSSTTGLVTYKSSAGEFKAGVQDADDHGVSVPGAPGLEDLPDATTFAFSKIADYKAFASTWAVPAAKKVSLTYASPTMGGFQLGAGVNGVSDIDLAVAGSFGAISVGVGITGAAATISTTGKVVAGASGTFSGITIGAGVDHNLATKVTGAEVGVKYASGPFTVVLTYDEPDVSTAGKGVVGAGVGYSENGLAVGADVKYTLATKTYKAAGQFSYKMAAVTLGAGATYDGTTIGANAGVDYALNSNVTVGAGVGYDGTNFGAAVGVKASF